MISNAILPLLILFVFIYASFKTHHSYNSFMNGVKDGLYLFVSVYPTMLAMSFAINLLRSSNILNSISTLLEGVVSFIPTEIIPMILFRPLSGSATLALLIDIFNTCGVDSLQGIMASIIQGSTDTTFYVLSLYFSHIGIKNIKNALKIGLVADAAGISAAIFLTIAFFS